jgi:hypothetical protein
MGTLAQTDEKRTPMATVGRRVARVKATRAMDLEEAANIVLVMKEVRREGRVDGIRKRKERKEKGNEKKKGEREKEIGPRQQGATVW